MSDDTALVSDRVDQLLAEADPKTVDQVTFRGRQYDLGLAWVHFPEGYGGLGLPPKLQREADQRIYGAGAQFPGARHFFALAMAGPTIVTNGDEAVKERLLRRAFTGEDAWCQLFSEPGAGSDLAGLATRAVRDGDEWVITGQKVWNTLAHIADRGMLVARTDPEAPKHKGISMIIIPTTAPGFRCVPIKNMGDMNTNQTFYDDVRVPKANVVGRINGGWKLITNQLNHERVTLCSAGMIEGPFDDFLAWARATRLADGRRVIDQPWVQQNVARIHARLEYMRLMNFKIAWEAEQELPMNPAYASSIKVFGTEFYMEACRLMLEVMGQAGTLRQDSPEAVLGGRIEFLLRGLHILTFGGGVNELQRDLIALFGLGMPVMPRF